MSGAQREFSSVRPEVYDALIDWPKRLANETPFYRQLIDEIGARRTLDAACGTGHHAALLHSWGLEVEGADSSPAMIAFCRAHRGEPAGLRWVERSFLAAPGADEASFDLVICVGNSLALATDAASQGDAAAERADRLNAVGRAVAAMLARLRPGGALVLQVLNLWRLAEGPTLWQKSLRVTIDGREHLVFKGVHRAGGFGYVDLIDAIPDDEPLRANVESARFVGLTAEEVEAMCRAGGASTVAFFGGYDRVAYDPQRSTDLIVVARR